MAKVTISIPTETKEKLKEVSIQLETSVSELLREWIGKILKSMK